MSLNQIGAGLPRRLQPHGRRQVPGSAPCGHTARVSLRAVYPIVVFLLDGLADRAHEVLGGRTGNEAAATPNLDALAARGSTGLLYAVGPGRAPSSEVAHWSMLGYRPDEFPGRAVFEALGRGQEVSDEHVFAYAALRPAERREDGWWLTGRPDPGRDVGAGRGAGRALRRDRGRRPDLLAGPRLARRGRAADLRRRRRAGHRHRRLLPRLASRCCGRSRSCPRPSARRRPARRGRAR